MTCPRFLAVLEGLVGEIRDPFQILFPLAGKAEHEVELHRLPARREDPFRRGEEFLFRISLVDDVAEALGARLGGQREARLPDPPDRLDQVRGEGFGAQRRERQGDPLGVVAVHERLEERFDERVVAGTEGEQGDLVVSRRLEHRLGHLLEDRRGPLPDGSPDHPRLAETAAARAAAGDLQGDPVVDRLHEGDDGTQRDAPGVQIGDDPFFDSGFAGMKVGHVDAGDRGQGFETLPAAFRPVLLTASDGRGDLADRPPPLRR